jgi:hypothetical protein
MEVHDNVVEEEVPMDVHVGNLPRILEVGVEVVPSNHHQILGAGEEASVHVHDGDQVALVFLAAQVFLVAHFHHVRLLEVEVDVGIRPQVVRTLPFQVHDMVDHRDPTQARDAVDRYNPTLVHEGVMVDVPPSPPLSPVPPPKYNLAYGTSEQTS